MKLVSSANTKSRSLSLAIAMAMVPMLTTLAPAAFAQATDYGSVLDGLDLGTAVTALIAAGALVALVGFTKWIVKKVARFFG